MTFVYVVRQNIDGIMGRPFMMDVGIFDNEDDAYNANAYVPGPLSNPVAFGGEIWKVELNTFPIGEEQVFGKRINWLDQEDYGWLDLRDQPDEKNPEWVEFQRLRKKFEPSVESMSIANPVGEAAVGDG